MTNYERLRNMTEAELAEWVSQRIDCPLCLGQSPDMRRQRHLYTSLDRLSN